MDSATHWDALYRGRATEELRWYQPRPAALDLVVGLTRPDDAIVDVGGGDSRLVDGLVAAGYTRLTVVDLSPTALDRARARLGAAAETVRWISGDVLKATGDQQWKLWHDRAVFHFFTAEQERRRYQAAAARSVSVGGHLVVSTFALDGPEVCAGLPVQRYDAETLAAVFEPEFRLVDAPAPVVDPVGPGDHRPYVTVVLERQQG